MKQDFNINKLIVMKEMLDEYLSNMDLLNDDGSVKEEKPTEKPTEEANEVEPEKEEVEPEDDEAKDDEISDRDAVIMIRKAR